MKILIPNAKEMNTNLDNAPFATLSSASQELLAVLSKMSPDELAKFYKINPDKATLEYDRWQRIANGQAKTYPAWQLYDGLMYRYMSRRDLTKEEMAYLKESVYITTGFYGAINVFDLISPHRLDFQGSLKIGSKSLKAFWRSQYDALVQEEELVISLLSSEFEAVFSPAIQKRMVHLTFMEERNGINKIHSTISKKGRGRFVSEMARHNVQTVEALKALSVDGFVYQEDLSSETDLVYLRPSTK
ncbi:peroxide stress protein YaaA [Streptococcus cameli]